MKIDINPIIEEANNTDRICMDMRDIEALYVVRLANGKDYTVKFDKKSLDEFQPSKTVSEMLIDWEDNILRRYNEAVKAVETGLHPTDRVNVPIMIELAHGHSIPSGKMTTEKRELDRYEIKHYESVIANLPKEFGKLTFHKLV